MSGQSGEFLLLSSFEEISDLNANSIDPDQRPHSEASDLGLDCLPMFLLWASRLHCLPLQYLDRQVQII